MLGSARGRCPLARIHALECKSTLPLYKQNVNLNVFRSEGADTTFCILARITLHMLAYKTLSILVLKTLHVPALY